MFFPILAVLTVTHFFKIYVLHDMFIQNYLGGSCSVVEDKWGTSRPSMYINCWPEDGKASKSIGGLCSLSNSSK